MEGHRTNFDFHPFSEIDMQDPAMEVSHMASEPGRRLLRDSLTTRFVALRARGGSYRNAEFC